MSAQVKQQGEFEHKANEDFRYDAFISYRHAEPDRLVAKLLQEFIETYRLPPSIARDTGTRPLRLFVDSTELAATHALSEELRAALAASRFLIVICSPRSRESPWIQQEIEEFIPPYS